MIVCKVCDEKYSNKQGLSRHLKTQHDYSLSGYQIDYIHLRVHPTCKCSCGEKVNWYCGNFRKYVKNHIGWLWNGSAKHLEHVKQINCNRLHEESVRRGKKSVKTRRKNGNLKQTKEAKEKISKTLKEKYESGERKPWVHTHDNPKPILKKAALKRQRTIEKRINNGEYKISFFNTKPENLFAQFLDDKNIKYRRQYKIKGSNHPYDFYIPSKNLIVEIDGDFWHCNEIVEHRWKDKNFNINGVYKKDIEETDKMHNEYAINNGYKLKRIWASEVEKGGGALSHI